MSSRDIEGENPLYLPQAKVYDRSCALGPCILLAPDPLPSSTEISLEIVRAGRSEFLATTTLASMKREPLSLVDISTGVTAFRLAAFCSPAPGSSRRTRSHSRPVTRFASPSPASGHWSMPWVDRGEISLRGFLVEIAALLLKSADRQVDLVLARG